MLGLNEISIRIGGRLLIDNASVQLPERGRVGLVGRNGTGKSSLLKAILGEIPLEMGAIRQRKAARIGTVAQEAPRQTTPLGRACANRERRASRELKILMTGSASRPSMNVSTILAACARTGLGYRLELDEAAQNNPRQFFRRRRMRVALAAGLFSEPDFLLLRPTNHLDLEAALG